MPTRNHRFQTALAVVAVTCASAIGSSQPTYAGPVGWFVRFNGVQAQGLVDSGDSPIGAFSVVYTASGYNAQSTHSALFNLNPGSLHASVGSQSDTSSRSLSQLFVHFDEELYFSVLPPINPPRDGEGDGDIPHEEFEEEETPSGPQYGWVSLNYHLSGQMDVTRTPPVVTPGPFFPYEGHAQASLDMSIFGNDSRLSLLRLSSHSSGLDFGIQGASDEDGHRIADILLDGTSSQFLMQSDVLVPFRLTLTLEAETNYPGGTAALDFMNTASFPTSGPVFNLPDGWTVNSLSGSIVNNRFVGVNSVPEPSSAVLLGLGALGVVARARRARCNRHA